MNPSSENARSPGASTSTNAGTATSSGAILTIDLGAIRANYRLLAQRAGGAACGAVLKADAYGLGAARVAPALADEGCRHFFVAHLGEGLALRDILDAAGHPHVDIFVMHGLMPGSERQCVDRRLIPVLNSLAQLHAWRTLGRLLGRRLPAIVQFDTGMARMGLSPGEVDRLLEERDGLSGLDVRYLMSHLACAENQDNPMNAAQLARFRALREKFPGLPASLANSSGIFLGADYQFDLVRPGAALYGLAPVAGAPNPMTPVVDLRGRIVQVRHVEAGEPVGYGCHWRAPARSTIATVAVGYADGWLRSLGNRGRGWIGGREMPMVGVVSMDTITFDASGVDATLLVEGAPVELIGPSMPADTVAALAGTIGYEILTGLGHRYHRNYV